MSPDGTGPTGPAADLRRRFVRLTLVNIASHVTVPLAGLVDTAMLGHLREIRFLAGVALASVLFDYLYWTVYFLRMGTTGTTAQAVGRGATREVWLTLYRALLLGAGIGIAFLLLQVPLREAGFALLSGEPGVEAAGRAYFDARIWGAPAVLANFVFFGWFLGREQARHALWMTVAANLANIVLNYVFIIRLQWAAFGAGLATMLAQYVSLAVALGIVLAQPDRLAPNGRHVADREGLGALVRLNLDILVRSLLLVTSFALFTNISATFGTTLLAANAVLGRVQTLAAYLIDGAAFAAETLAGVLFGAGRLAELRRFVRLSLGVSLGFSALVLAAFYAWPSGFFRLMTSHEAVAALGVRYAPWLAPTLLLGSLAFMYDGLFLGMTLGRRLRNAMLVSTLVFFVPPALVAWRLGDNDVLWGAMTLFMAARAATLAWSLRGVWREN